MPPKKKGIWRESKDVVDGWSYTVYNYGLVKVGNGNENWTVRLTSFNDVDPNDSAAHKECVRLERLARQLFPKRSPLELCLPVRWRNYPVSSSALPVLRCLLRNLFACAVAFYERLGQFYQWEL